MQEDRRNVETAAIRTGRHHWQLMSMSEKGQIGEILEMRRDMGNESGAAFRDIPVKGTVAVKDHSLLPTQRDPKKNDNIVLPLPSRPPYVLPSALGRVTLGSKPRGSSFCRRLVLTP
jgi:hypothetical protein